MRRLLVVLILWAIAPGAGAASLEALIAERARADYAAGLAEDARLQIALRSAAPGDAVGIAEFWMDPRTGRFLANAVRPSGEVQRVSGVVQVSLPVPVPTRRIMPGEVIGPADLAVVRLPAGDIGVFARTDLADLVGMEARRVRWGARPVMAQSVTRPFAVARGDRVIIALNEAGLRLTAPGRALSDAHTGEDVRVVNLTSNKTLTGIAHADGLVEIAK